MIDWVKHWKEKEDVFFHKTRGLQAVEEALREQNIVTITGAPGSGKSLMAKHIALQYQKDGYNIYPLLNPEEVEKFYCRDGQKKQFFFFDDPVGDSHLNDNFVSNWKRRSESLKCTFTRRNVKCLITMRSHLINKITLEKVNCVLTDNVINITKKELELSKIERIKIFKAHCKDDVPPKGAMLCSYDCFPLLCYVYSTSNKTKNIFVDPFSVIKRQIHELYEKNHTQFTALVLCSVLDKCSEDLFDPFLNNEMLTTDRSRMKTVLDALDFDCRRSCEIKKELDSICGIFLRKSNGIYTFIHILFEESVVFCMGEKSAKFIFEYFKGEFINKRVRLGKKLPSDANEELLIILNDNEQHRQMMRDRVLKDLLKKNFQSVFTNPYITSNYIQEPICLTIKSNEFDINGLDEYSMTVLHWATLLEKGTLIECILETEIDIDRKGLHGVTALLFAVCKGSVNEVELLLDHKANPNLSDNQGNYALHRAIQISSLQMLRILLDHGADVNNAGSPLLLAVQMNEIEMAKLLLEHKADINASLCANLNALYFAAFNNNTKMVKLLIDKGATVKDKETALILSAENGNIEMTSLLISAGVDINAESKDHDTALVAAIRSNNRELVKYLLSEHADINSKGRIIGQKWWDALQCTYRLLDDISTYKLVLSYQQLYNIPPNWRQIIKMYLKEISKLYETDEDNNFLSFCKKYLHVLDCIEMNSLEEVLYFFEDLDNLELEKYIDNINSISILNAFFNNLYLDNFHNLVSALKQLVDEILELTGPEYLALNVAVYGDIVEYALKELLKLPKKDELENNVKMVQLLMDNHADVNLPGKHDKTPLTFAIGKGNMEMLQLLVNKADINLLDGNGDRALHLATIMGDVKTVKLLLKNKADVNLRNNFGNCAIHLAVAKCNLEIVEILMDNDANITLPNEDGDRALHFAAREGNVKITELLVKNEVDVNMGNNFGNHALMFATIYNNVEVVKVLLRNKATVNLQNNIGAGALYYATYNCNVEIVKILLDNGADVNLSNKRNIKALHNAALKGNVKILRLFVGKSADVNVRTSIGNTPLILATKLKHTEAVQLLLENKSKIDMRDDDGNAALIFATIAENLQIMELLLNNHADVNLPNKNSETALHLGTTKNNVQIVSLLLNKGADVNMLDKDGNTALILATKENNVDIVNILLRSNADVNVVNKSGNAALDWALKNNNEKIARLLKEKVDITVCNSDCYVEILYNRLSTPS